MWWRHQSIFRFSSKWKFYHFLLNFFETRKNKSDDVIILFLENIFQIVTKCWYFLRNHRQNTFHVKNIFLENKFTESNKIWNFLTFLFIMSQKYFFVKSLNFLFLEFSFFKKSKIKIFKKLRKSVFLFKNVVFYFWNRWIMQKIIFQEKTSKFCQNQKRKDGEEKNQIFSKKHKKMKIWCIKNRKFTFIWCFLNSTHCKTHYLMIIMCYCESVIYNTCVYFATCVKKVGVYFPVPHSFQLSTSCKTCLWNLFNWWWNDYFSQSIWHEKCSFSNCFQCWW